MSLSFSKIGNNMLQYFPTCGKIPPLFSHILGNKPIGFLMLGSWNLYCILITALGKRNPNFNQPYPKVGISCPLHFLKIGNNMLKYFPTCEKKSPIIFPYSGEKTHSIPNIGILKKISLHFPK